MKKFRWFLTLAMAATVIGGPVLAQQSHIPKAQLEEMFANIQTGTSWNLKQDMLWGYFFTSPKKSELEKAGLELKKQGYRLVEIRKLESDPSDALTEWQLHVDRVEIHTVDTLNNRNIQLEALAGHYTAVVYDGMDVGPTS